MDDPRPTYDECPICHNPVCAASAQGITAGTRAALIKLVHRKPVPPEPTLEAGRETANESMVFERLSMALTGGSASTWDQIFHAAEQHLSGDPRLETLVMQLPVTSRARQDYDLLTSGKPQVIVRLEESQMDEIKRLAPETDLLGAAKFVLAFYEPGQTHLDTEAWKKAEAGLRRAVARVEAITR